MHPHDGVHLRPRFVTGDRPYILLHGYFNAGGFRRHNLKKGFLHHFSWWVNFMAVVQLLRNSVGRLYGRLLDSALRVNFSKRLGYIGDEILLSYIGIIS